jgi:hypothetical protein
VRVTVATRRHLNHSCSGFSNTVLLPRSPLIVVVAVKFSAALRVFQDRREQNCLSASDQNGTNMPVNFQQQSPYYIGWGTLALINAGLAQSKNRSGLGWFLISLLLGPIATFLVVVIDPVRKA